MKAKVHIIVLLLLCTAAVYSQTGSIKFMVRHMTGKGRAAAADSALVRLAYGDSIIYKAYTDSQGNCLIERVRSGRYEVLVSKRQKETVVVPEVFVTEGKMTVLPVMMGRDEPAKNKPPERGKEAEKQPGR